MKNITSISFTDLPKELRGAVGTQLDLSSLARLKITAKNICAPGAQNEPLLADDMVDPLLAASLSDPAVRQLRNGQHREQLSIKLEAMLTASDKQGRARAVQLIEDFTQIESASPAQLITLLGGPEEQCILPPIQRLAMVTNPDTDSAVLARLSRNDDASVAELVAIVDGGNRFDRVPAGPLAHALGKTHGRSIGNLIAQRIAVASAADRMTFLQNPRTPSKILITLATSSKESDELLSIIAHSNADRSVIASVAAKASLPSSSSVRATIFGHQMCDDSILAGLAESARSKEEYAEVLTDARTGPMTLCVLGLNMPYRDLRVDALAHASVSARVLTSFAENAVNDDERRAILAYPELDQSALLLLVQCALTPQHCNDISDHEKAGINILLKLARTATDPVERERLSTHRSVSLSMLYELAGNKPLAQRIAAAADSSARHEAFVKIAEYPRDLLVRLVLSQNPSMPIETLDSLASEVCYPPERLAIAKHPRTSTKALAMLASQFLYA